jgi:hypothetical protein
MTLQATMQRGLRQMMELRREHYLLKGDRFAPGQA